MKVSFIKNGPIGSTYDGLSFRGQRSLRQTIADSIERVCGQVEDRIDLPRLVAVSFDDIPDTVAEACGQHLRFDTASAMDIKRTPDLLDGVVAHEVSHISDYLVQPKLTESGDPFSAIVSEGKAQHLAIELVGVGGFDRSIRPEPTGAEIDAVYRHYLAPLPVRAYNRAVSVVGSWLGGDDGYSYLPGTDLCVYGIGQQIVGRVIAHVGETGVTPIHAMDAPYYRAMASDAYRAAAHATVGSVQ